MASEEFHPLLTTNNYSFNFTNENTVVSESVMIVSHTGSVDSDIMKTKHVNQVYAKQLSTMKWTFSKSCRMYCE